VERFNAWGVDELIYLNIAPAGRFGSGRSTIGGTRPRRGAMSRRRPTRVEVSDE